MSSEQVIKATVWIEGEASMGRYYLPDVDMDETRKRLREAKFLLTGREGMSSEGHWFNKEIKATVPGRARRRSSASSRRTAW